jgi:hypothetical protein
MKQYIIRTDKPFTGSVQSFLLEDGRVAYTSLTWEEYKDRHPEMELVSEAALYGLMKKHFDDMCDGYDEITEQRYYELLECLPPKRWKRLSDDVFPFFVGEPSAGEVYQLCLYHKPSDKYFSKLERISASDEKILNNFEWYLNSIGIIK